jgi:hypothetical protein
MLADMDCSAQLAPAMTALVTCSANLDFWCAGQTGKE